MSSSNSDNKKPKTTFKEQLSRRNLIKGAGLAGGAIGLSTLFQNCAPGKANFAQEDRSALSNTEALNCPSGGGGGSGGGHSPSDVGSRIADQNITVIGGEPVKEAAPSTQLDLKAISTVAVHRNQVNSSANNEQRLLIVSVNDSQVGASPDNTLPAAIQDASPIQFSAQGSMLGIQEVLCYVKGIPSPILRRVFHAGDPVASAMFLLPDSLVANESHVTVVSKHALHGYWKKDIPLEQNVYYKDLVPGFSKNTPFGSSSYLLPYVAGAGMASGGQGDLGDVHTPVFDIGSNNITVILGKGTPHARFDQNHYTAGCALYDQNGHPLGAIQSIMYGNNHTEVSVAHFENLRLSERGVTQLRAVCFDTYNGYVMGFHKIS